MLTFVVMPCLNEVALIEGAISSLMHPSDNGEPMPRIVVVDNGSTDGTLELLERRHRNSPSMIHVVKEPIRGFVPPRRRGVLAVADLAAALDADPRDVLILQADADTVYRPGYVAAMRRAAQDAEGAILEGACRRPPTFETGHPDYVAAERMVDAAVEPLEAADADDVIVDDKVCAYHLSDYLRWGGLFEERTAAGDQVHAETTRMYIRALLTEGTQKVRVNQAGAMPSRRRAIEDPRHQFSTLGFPREKTWAMAQTARWASVDVDEFARSVLAGCEGEAVRLRIAHLLALFRILPALILRAAGRSAELLQQEDVAAAMRLVPVRTGSELAKRPAAAIMDVLALIDSHPDLLVAPVWQATKAWDPS